MMAAALGLAEMFVGAPSAEVLVVASDQRQANITLKYARRMVELNPVLAERVQVYADRLYLPENDATLLPLPAEPGALHGHDPSLQIVDELHVVTEEVWEAVTSVAGKRPESLTLAISTPAASPDSVMWRLVEHGRAGDDRRSTSASSPPRRAARSMTGRRGGSAIRRWRAVTRSCPRTASRRRRRRSAKPVFRQLRLGQWVTGVEAWLPWGAWDTCRAERTVQPRSVSSWRSTGPHRVTPPPWWAARSTGICGSKGCGRTPAIRAGGFRARTSPHAVDVAFAKYDVVELACDPWGWRSEIEDWAKRHGERRVIEWNTAHAAADGPGH